MTKTGAPAALAAAGQTPGDPQSVQFVEVNKSFGPTQVLKDLSFDIEAGTMTAFLGPSGCGKTTTIRVLAGFEPVDSGDVLVGGASVLGLPANRRDMGMVFQSYSLFPNLSVAENIEYGLQIRRVDATARHARCERLLEVCGLEGMNDRYPHQLSGGQQQRVALARALATQPRVLLLDEPLSALDAAVRSSLRDEIRRVQQSTGTTTLFITHDQSEALAISDHVAVMYDGKIEQYAAPSEIYTHPATPFVARFVGTINEFEVAAGWSPTDPLRVDAPGDDVIFVRPENMRIEPDDDGQLTVSTLTYMGERTMAHLGHPGTAPKWTASLSAAEAAAVPVGTRVRVGLAGEPAMRLPRSQAESSGA